ncbi:YcaO-like family protein [Micromonospora chalcea]|uniref:YcaO-like family protein n=1 Tax=Micromonospora chalcea TaxID=1874 RepID=UPI0016571BEF|nr:YcaO-like family protein [Micromonospora chalcea]MBC8988727.1 YcaO-like family protein [Micromonospora chalcea]
MALTAAVVRDDWKCVRFTSPFDGLFGSVVEADDDVLGVAWDLDPARADERALGEAVERAALHEPALAPVRASANELGSKAIRLDDRATFSPEQCSQEPLLRPFAWNAHSQNTWVTMQSPDGEVFVPADVERMRVHDSDPTRVKPMTSIGAACGVDWDTALTRALTEVVERHAVAVAVYSGRRAARVRPGDDRYSVHDIAEILDGAADVVVGLLPGSHFGLQVALAAIVGTRDGLPEVAFGSAAHADAADAIRSAAIEAVHIFHLGWRLLRRGDPEERPVGINTRALWWARHGRAHLGDYFVDQVAEAQGPTSGGRTWTEIGDAISAERFRWAYSDITPAWAAGAVVARAVVPALLHLQINPFPLLYAPRFPSEVEAFLRRSGGGVNNDHPFV